MIEKIKAFLRKDREVLLYLLFGGLTTVVDFGVSFLLYRLLGDAMEQNRLLIHAANAVAWVCAVLFAFFTNRVWVFRSDRRGFLPILLELFSFAGGRVLTFLLQEGVIALFYDVLALNKYAVRIGAAILVILLNYVISKLLVFRKKKESGDA